MESRPRRGPPLSGEGVKAPVSARPCGREFRWYHGLLFALSRKARGVFILGGEYVEFEICLEDYAVEDFAAFWHGFMEKTPGAPPPNTIPPKPVLAAGRFFSWFFIVMGPLCIVNSLWQGKSMRMEGGGLFIWFLNLGLTTPLGGVLVIAFGALCLRQIRRDAKSPSESRAPSCPRWAKRAWKRYQAAPRLRSCRFDGEGCWIYDAQSDHRYDYGLLDKLWEDAGHYYLVLPGCRIYILPKRSFAKGVTEDLPALWQERTGKQVLPVSPVH